MTMTRHMSRTWDRSDAVSTARAREAFREDASDLFEEARREAEIAALPVVEWKGRRLRTIRCHGTTGKGPHDYNVPESFLWALISLQRFTCPYHS